MKLPFCMSKPVQYWQFYMTSSNHLFLKKKTNISNSLFSLIIFQSYKWKNSDAETCSKSPSQQATELEPVRPTPGFRTELLPPEWMAKAWFHGRGVTWVFAYHSLLALRSEMSGQLNQMFPGVAGYARDALLRKNEMR